MKELTDAGFRVRREQASGDRVAVVAESDTESYRVVYHYRQLRPDLPRAWVFAPGTTPTAGHAVIEVSGALAPAIGALRDGQAFEQTDFDEGCVFIPPKWSTHITGAGGALTFGRARLGPHAYAVQSITGSRADLDGYADNLHRAFPDAVSGLWARDSGTSRRFDLAPTVVGAAEDTLARAHGLSLDQIRERLRAGLGALVRSTSGVDGPAEWLFVRRGPADEPLLLHTRTVSAAAYSARAPFSRILAGRRVVLIGCGSVGWTVALQLARSGVDRFVLYDDDTVQPYNLARLDSYLGFVARMKASALAEQLQAVAPGIEAEARTFQVGTEIGARVLVEDAPDLLINLTGEEISTDETNIASLLLGRPAIFAWVSNGVVAGRIIRVRPDASACYECVRTAAPDQIHSQGEVPTGREQAWLGAGFNVDTFASAVSRLAVLTLAGEPVSSTNPDHVVLDFGGVVPVSRAIHIDRDPNCAVCR